MKHCAVLNGLITMAERKEGQVLYTTTAGNESGCCLIPQARLPALTNIHRT